MMNYKKNSCHGPKNRQEKRPKQREKTKQEDIFDWPKFTLMKKIFLER